MRMRYAVSVVALAVCLQTRADIVGMWLFEEGAGDVAVDSSGLGHDGTLIDGAGWGAGAYGGAVEFDDTGFIEWEHHDDLSFDETLTFMIFARIDAITPQEWVGMPRKENEYTFAGHSLGATMEMTLWLNIGGGWIGQIPAGGVFPAHSYGEWHHYAATYDGAVVTLFLDGEAAGEVGVTVDVLPCLEVLPTLAVGARVLFHVAKEGGEWMAEEVALAPRDRSRSPLRARENK